MWRWLWIILFLGPALAEEPAPLLPKEWHGTWTGKLVITNPGDKRTDVPMSLRIEPIKDSRDLTWVLTYGDDPKARPRDYKLIAGATPSRLKIDERNGIVLDARLVGNVLYSYFEVGGALLTARYERRGDTLWLEITSSKKSADKANEHGVQGYTTDVVQSAELKRKS